MIIKIPERDQVKEKIFTLCNDLCWSLFKFGSERMYDSAGSWLNRPPLSNLGAYKHPN
jgi:hypothetical protein